MKSIRITGLCLVAMFAVSLVASATASANWEQCQKGTGSGTKWETSQCVKVGAPNEYEWKVVEGTEKVETNGTLRLIDKKTLAGVAEVICTGTDTGAIGPSQFARIESITTVSCKAEKVCEPPVTAKPVHLPWQTVEFETESKKRTKITETGNGQPGWEVICKTLLGEKTVDVCETESGKEGTPEQTNKQASGSVQVTFDANAGKAKCSLGGKEQGEVRGAIQVFAAGYAIRVQ
jgi:hypothetical protein